MKKFRRIAIVTACVLIGLLGAALLAVNLYVQSKGTQARIQQELSQRLGTTLHIRRISVTPWFGLKLTGITMPQGEEAVRGDFLRADTFRLRVRLASLFARRLVITEVSLVNPNVVWAQNKDGQWRLPSMPEYAKHEAPPEEPPPPAAAAPPSEATGPAISPTGSSAPVEEPGTGEVAEKSFTPEVRRVNLTNGNFHFLDVKGKPVATFEKVGFRSTLRKSTELRGNASIGKISLRNRFFLRDLKSQLRYDPFEIALSQITAQAAGGEITGRFSLRPADEDSPFEAMVSFRGVEADRLVAEAGGPAGMVQGRIEGRLDAKGRTADPNALAGTGEIFLRNGEVRSFSLLVALGQLLQIDELKQLRLDQAQVKFHIVPGVVMVDELILSSPNIRLSAAGTIDFQGRLKLESQLAINERVRRQLFGSMRESFRPIELPGFTAVDFQVTGTLERPKSNLITKVVGKDLRDLGGVINSLLGSGKAKKKATEELPVASPSPAFAPPVDAAIAPEQPSPALSPADAPQATPSP